LEAQQRSQIKLLFIDSKRGIHGLQVSDLFFKDGQPVLPLLSISDECLRSQLRLIKVRYLG